MNKHYIDDFNKYATEITNKYNELNKQLSNIDSQQQDLLHYLENEKCDAVTMVKISKKLKDIREQRRVIKNELSVVSAVYARIGSSTKVLKEPNNGTVYHYRTKVMDEITS